MVHDTLACLGQRIGRINAISDHPIITDLSTARQPTPAFPPSTGTVVVHLGGRRDSHLLVPRTG